MGDLPLASPTREDGLRLPGDLLLRRATPRDREALTAFQAAVQTGPDGSPNQAAGAWTHDLLGPDHPTTGPQNVTLVEDRSRGLIVSCLALVPQTWSYAGIPFGVGRLELVATHPEYRRRGLISRQLSVLHHHSAQRGDLMQAITDLMFFHGEQGYRMALTQRAGRGGWFSRLPHPAGGEPVELRPARQEDIPAFLGIDRHARERVLLSCVRDERAWRYEVEGRSAASMVRDEVLTLCGANGPIGYAVLGYGGIPTFPVPEWFPGSPCPESVVSVTALELAPGTCWTDLAYAFLRQLARYSGQEGFLLWLGPDHPAYHVLDEVLCRRPPQVGWFLRIPDVSRLLARVAPVLERRLSGSAMRGFSGTLRIHLYAEGVLLRFVDGRLIEAAPWSQPNRRASDVSMPDQMFFQLVLGHATLDELSPAFPDCRVQTPVGRTLLPALFPKQVSGIWPLA